MSQPWPPPQQEPPPQAGWPQPWYPPQPPNYGHPGYGYGAGYGAEYGAPGPSSTGQPGGWPPRQGDPWSQWGEVPAQEQYQPGRPSPHVPQYPYPASPVGAPYPYGVQDPYGMQDPYGPYGPYGPNGTRPPQQRPRGRSWLLPVLVLMVCGILVASGGAYALTRYGPRTTAPPATAQGTAGAHSQTPGTSATFHAYTNADMGVEFDVPDGWITKNDGTQSGVREIEVGSPDGMSVFLVASIPGEGKEVELANLLLTTLSDSKAVDYKEGPAQVTIGEANWVRMAGDVTTGGMRLHVVVLSVTHGSHVFALVFGATASDFAAANARYFQAVTRSFQFLT